MEGLPVPKSSNHLHNPFHTHGTREGCQYNPSPEESLTISTITGNSEDGKQKTTYALHFTVNKYYPLYSFPVSASKTELSGPAFFLVMPTDKVTPKMQASITNTTS